MTEAREGHPWYINLQSRRRPGAFYMRKHSDLSGVGTEGRRGFILITGREIESKISSCSPHVFLQEMRLDSAVYFSKPDGDDPAK